MSTSDGETAQSVTNRYDPILLLQLESQKITMVKCAFNRGGREYIWKCFNEEVPTHKEPVILIMSTGELKLGWFTEVASNFMPVSNVLYGWATPVTEGAVEELENRIANDTRARVRLDLAASIRDVKAATHGIDLELFEQKTIKNLQNQGAIDA